MPGLYFILYPASSRSSQIKVEFTRPLKPSDAADKRWVVTEARPITWAMGPLSEASTNTTPIVLFHQINVSSANSQGGAAP